MLVSSFFFLKNNYKTKNIYSSCRASKWQFPLALTELPLVNTSGLVQFSSPEIHITLKNDDGSVVVDLLLNVLPIVCGCSVFVFVLLCMTLSPF